MKTFLLILLSFLSCSYNFSQENMESNFASRIMESKAFQTQLKEIEKLSEGKRTLKLITVSEPSEIKPYFYFKASEDNGYNYVTHIHFKAYLDDNRIVIYDPIEDDESEME